MPKKGTSKADGTLSQKELDTLKKANEKSRSPASIAKRKATFAANRALKEQLGTPLSRVSPLVEDYLRQSLLFPDEKTGKPYLHVFIDNFLKEAKANPGSIPGQRLAAAMFTTELLTQLDEEVNKQMSKDLEFTYYRIRQTLYNKQQEVFDNDRDKIIMALCSRRVGKTELAARLLAKDVVKPNRHCVYINRSFDAAVRQIKNPLEQVLEKVGLSYNGTINGGKLDFDNGSWILIIGNNNAADVNKLRGEKLSCVICDEAGHMRHLREMFQEVIMPATMDYEDAHIYMIGTPPRIPNGFVHELWDSTKPAKYHWTFMDNPFIPNRDKVIEEACELYSVSPDSAFIKREYFGDMNAADFDAMPFHNNMKYDKLPDNTAWERAYVGVDYGYDDRAAVVTVLVKDKKAYIYDCWCNNKQTVTALCDEVERQVANAKKLPLGNSTPMIITDTNEKAITAELYYQRHLNNVCTAYKYDLQYGLEQLSEWMKNGTFSTPKDCWINEECENTIWKRDEETGKIIHELDDDVFHPNALFAVLYISRQFAYEVLSLSDNNKQAKEIA